MNCFLLFRVIFPLLCPLGSGYGHGYRDPLNPGPQNCLTVCHSLRNILLVTRCIGFKNLENSWLLQSCFYIFVLYIVRELCFRVTPGICLPSTLAHRRRISTFPRSPTLQKISGPYYSSTTAAVIFSVSHPYLFTESGSR
jgi:hypothetical protein